MGKLYLLFGDYIGNSNGMNAIVNAANKYMIGGSGICGVIYGSAGLELEDYCKNCNMRNVGYKLLSEKEINLDEYFYV